MAILVAVVLSIITYTLIGGIWFWVLYTYTGLDDFECSVAGLIWPLSIPVGGIVSAFRGIAHLLDSILKEIDE